MASGEKLPNTNLNLIQDIDMIDYADINAIAQAVESNATRVDAFYPYAYLEQGTDLHTVGAGVHAVGGNGYVNGVGASMYGVLTVTDSEAASRKFLMFHSHNNRVYVKAKDTTSWSSWKELGLTEAEGTWTPRLEGTYTAGVAEYSTRNGAWRRIGDTVFIQAHMIISSFTGGSGSFIIKGLPDSFSVKYTTYLGANIETLKDLGVSHVGMAGNNVYLFSEMGTHAVSTQNFTSSKAIQINGAIQLNAP